MRTSKNPLKDLEKALRNTGSGHENERRAAAAFVEFLLRFDRRSLQKLKRLAISSLKELKADENFTYEWKDSAALKRELNKEIRRLSK